MLQERGRLQIFLDGAGPAQQGLEGSLALDQPVKFLVTEGVGEARQQGQVFVRGRAHEQKKGMDAGRVGGERHGLKQVRDGKLRPGQRQHDGEAGMRHRQAVAQVADAGGIAADQHLQQQVAVATFRQRHGPDHRGEHIRPADPRHPGLHSSRLEGGRQAWRLPVVGRGLQEPRRQLDLRQRGPFQQHRPIEPELPVDLLRR